MSDDLRNVDVAIVGGGIVGCAVALAARRIGLTAAIFERGRICGEASSVAAGLICGQYDADYDTPLLRLRLAGRDVFPEFAQLLESLGGAPVGYLKGPTMGIAWTDEQRKRLLTRVATQQEAELDVEFLEPEEARRREPLLAPGVAGAALYPDGQVDTHRWAPIVHRAVLAAGVDVHEGAEVVELSGGAHASVRTVRGTVSADHVVLATGAWARELLPWVPVAPSKGHIITFEAPNLRTRHIINMPSGTLSQRSDGRLIFGATKERVGFDRRLQAGAVASLLSAATAAVPGLAAASLSGILTGFRPGTRGRPAIDRARPPQRRDAGHRSSHPRRHDELANGPDRRPVADRSGPGLPNRAVQPRSIRHRLIGADRPSDAATIAAVSAAPATPPAPPTSWC